MTKLLNIYIIILVYENKLIEKPSIPLNRKRIQKRVTINFAE